MLEVGAPVSVIRANRGRQHSEGFATFAGELFDGYVREAECRAKLMLDRPLKSSGFEVPNVFARVVGFCREALSWSALRAVTMTQSGVVGCRELCAKSAAAAECTLRWLGSA